jgi:hypothetical protein
MIMGLVFYSIKSEVEGKRVLGMIKDSVPDEKIRVLRTLVGLASSLHNFPSPDIALLLIADQEELASVLSLKKYLTETKVILVLPDRSEASLKLSLALSPLLVCFLDSSFAEVVAVMARLKREKQARMIEIDPKRYCWDGALPHISSLPVIDDVDHQRLPGELPFYA